MLIASHAMSAVYPLKIVKKGILGILEPSFLEEIRPIALFLCTKGECQQLQKSIKLLIKRL
jgi:hypothetical protein